MISRKHNTVFEIVNYVLAFFLVLPMGVFLEQVCGFPLGRCCFIPCISLIGYALGRWSMPKHPPVAVAASIIGAIAAGAAAFFLAPAGLLIHVLLVLLALFFAVFFFFSARKAGYTVYAPMSITGILIHVLILFMAIGLEFNQRAVNFASICAIIFFLLTLYSFSAQGLRKSLHKGSGEKSVTFPAGMQMGNFLLVTGFIIIAAFASNIHPVFQVFSKGFVYVIRWIFTGIAYIKSLFAHKGPLIEEESSSNANNENENILMQNEPKGEAAAVTAGVEIFSFLIVLILVVIAALKIYQKLRKAGLKLPAFMQHLRDRFNPVVDEDYIDETENLFDTGKLLGDTGARLKQAITRLRERPQKISDFKDNRMKLRFAYQQILKKQLQRDPAHISRTPNELYATCFSGREDMKQLIEDYNRARYSSEDITDDSARRAETILKQRL